MRILAIEDERHIAQAVEQLLADYNYAVDIAADGEMGLAMAEAYAYDLIILDIGLPQIDGVEVCKRLRERHFHNPILLLTGRAGSENKAIALNAGADDYVVKPFDNIELIARVQALLRRPANGSQPLLTWGDLAFDPNTRQVSYGDRLLVLTPKEYAILELLLRNPRSPLSSRAILERVWTAQECPAEEVVRGHIKELRHKLVAADAPKNFIKTVYGVGYRLNPVHAAMVDEPSSIPQVAELAAVNEELRETLDRLRVTQDILRASEERYRLLSEISPVGIFRNCVDGHFTYVNEKAAQLVGLPPAECLGLHWINTLHPGDLQRVCESWNNFVARSASGAAATHSFECRHLHPNGEIVWVLVNIVTECNAKGVITGYMGTLTDITERKQAEEELQVSQKRQAFLLTLNDRLRNITDPEEIQFVAATALGEDLGASRVGYAEDRGDGETIVVTRNYTNGVPSIEGCYRYDDYGAELLREFRAGHTVVRNDIANDPNLTAAEKKAHAELQLGATVNIPLLKSGRLVAVLFMHYQQAHEFSATELALLDEVAVRTWDAVERARAEAALRASEAKYRSLFESIDEGFASIEMIFDEAGNPSDCRYLETNQVFQRQTGLNDVIGKRLLEIVPNIEPEWIDFYGRVALTGEAARIEYHTDVVVGQWYSVYASRVGGEDSRQVAVVFDDITERKLRERQQEFLLKLSDALRPLTDPLEIQRAVMRIVGEWLQVDRVLYAEIAPDGETWIVRDNYTSTSLPKLIGSFPTEVFGTSVEKLKRGELVIIPNVETATDLTEAEKDLYKETNTRSVLSVPLIKDGRWISNIGVHHAAPREWTAEEIALVQKTMERTWATVERARAEAALRDHEGLLHLALSAAQAGTWDWDIPTDRVAWNDRMFELLGYQVGQVTPSVSAWRDRIHPSDLEWTTQLLQKALENQTLTELEYRVVYEDRSVHWLLVRAQGIYDLSGQPMRMVGIVMEITERKLAEIHNQTNLEIALDAAQMGTWYLDVERDLSTVRSLRHDLIFGYDRLQPEWSREIARRHILPEDLEIFDAAFDLAMITGELDFEVRVRWPDGSIHWMAARGLFDFDRDGNVTYGCGVNFDITERKQAEKTIQEQAALLDIATDAIFVRDLDHRILYWNQGAERMYGWSAAAALGQQVNDLLRESGEQIAEIMQTTIDRGEWQGEVHTFGKSGRELTVEGRWTLMRDEAGQPKSILCVNTDISEKKQLQAQFYQAQRLESLGTLASGIAHDLNNVLTPVLAFAQILRRQPGMDEKTQARLQIIEDNARRGADMVDRILTFARGTSGTYIVLQVSHVLRDVVKVAQQTFPKSIEIERHLPTDLFLVSGDATQLHQVFLNLCVNARDAMPHGGTLRITAENQAIDEMFARLNLNVRAGNYVLVTIADTGVGIPLEILDRIFDPFFTTKSIGEGTGLGLATVLGIVTNHGGFVRVTSTVGQGTEFKVYLPATEGEEKEIAIVPEVELPKGKGELILVVDDDPAVREANRSLLEDHNYQTLIASDGIEAMAVYAQQMQEIDLVLIDAMMPHAGGATAIRTICRMNPQVKILAISGLSSNRESLLAAGARGFLAKPYQLTDLLQSVSKLLNDSISLG